MFHKLALKGHDFSRAKDDSKMRGMGFRGCGKELYCFTEGKKTPPGLKPNSFYCLIGTTEVVP